MTTENKTKPTIDTEPAKLLTIRECYEKAGGFPFKVVKLKLTGLPNEGWPTFKVLTVIDTFGNSDFRVNKASRIGGIVGITDTNAKVWSLI
jgi:hypothetical protein